MACATPSRLPLFVAFRSQIVADKALFFRSYAAVPPLLPRCLFGSKSREFSHLAADSSFKKIPSRTCNTGRAGWIVRFRRPPFLAASVTSLLFAPELSGFHWLAPDRFL